MRPLAILAAVSLAFATGMIAGRTPRQASAAVAELQPQIIDVGAMTDKDLGAILPKLGTLRSKTLVATPQGVVSVQTGEVPKHMHYSSDEIQFVVSGSGMFWLGSQQRPIHAGDLIIIPRHVAHAGTHTTGGELKVIAIKLPPAVAGDYHPVN